MQCLVFARYNGSHIVQNVNSSLPKKAPRSPWMIIKALGRILYRQMSQSLTFLDEMGPIMAGDAILGLCVCVSSTCSWVNRCCPSCYSSDPCQNSLLFDAATIHHSVWLSKQPMDNVIISVKMLWWPVMMNHCLDVTPIKDGTRSKTQ